MSTNPDPPTGPDPGDLEHALVQCFLEHVPDSVYFKDRQSRFIAVSRSKANRHGFDDPKSLVGKTDADLFSSAHASSTRDEEEAIMRTGEPMINRFEKVTWPDGRQTWARTSKLPLRDERGENIGTFGLSEDVTEAKQREEALEQARREVIDASRMAGMADMATGVLHNVGNVLNSLNVSSNVIAAGLRQSKLSSLSRVSALLDEHAGGLQAFLNEDPKGRMIPDFLRSLARHAAEENARLLAEIESLQKHIDHIKEIVSMQQAYATMAGVVETLDASSLMEDALRMNSAALVRHEVNVLRDYQPAPAVVAERGKVLQILVNLIRNAKYAVDEGRATDKAITLRVEPCETGMVRLIVQDNGVGIPPGNLTRIFTHGFTTRAHGHGFGLHSSSLAAKEMRGSLTAASDGLNTGATFVLELPAHAEIRGDRP